MALSFTRVVLIGAGGGLGSKILDRLLKEAGVTKITILSRTSSKSTFPSSPKLNLIKLDYTDETALIAAFKDQDIVISAIQEDYSGKLLDLVFLEAAIKAGIQRFMPSEWTLDLMHPGVKDITDGTVVNHKIEVQEVLNAAAANSEIEFTTIVCSSFLDLAFEVGYSGFDIPGRKVTLYDEGIQNVTGSTRDFVAQCVLTVLKMPKEATRNKRIRVAEARFTGKEVVEALEDMVGEKFEVSLQTTEALLNAAKEVARAGNPLMGGGMTILVVYYGGSGAGDLRDGLEWNSSGEFAIPRKSLKEIVKEAAETLRK